MDLSLSEEQEILKKEARRFLIAKCPKTLVREMEEDEKGYSPKLWQEMAELGWLGLAFPDKYGGSGMGFLDLAILLEEMGRACLPSPFFSTVILGGLTILSAGSEAQKQKYLPLIASGKAIFTLALTEPSARYEAASIRVKATLEENAYFLNGTKLFVPDAHIADYLICVAQSDEEAGGEGGISLFLSAARSPGISWTALKTIAGDRLFEVVFNQVKVPQEGILGQPNQGWGEVERAMERAVVAKCCEMVGGAQRVLEMTVDYAKERVQFGRPIGSFQAIQHHCANMAIDVYSSRLITYQAVWMLTEGLPCTKVLAMAKAWTSEAYQRVSARAHQVHGAIGFTTDHDLQLYTRRAKAAEVTFGAAHFQEKKAARAMGFQLGLSIPAKEVVGEMR